MPRRAASNDRYALGIDESLTVVVDSVERNEPALVHHTPPYTVRKRGRLFKYLLGHEMRIAALLKLGNRHLELLDVNLVLLIVERKQA